MFISLGAIKMKTYLLRTLSLFSTLMVFSLAHAEQKNDPKYVEIGSGYEDPATGQLIIRFKYKYKSQFTYNEKVNPDFFGNNLSFFGNEENLFQINEIGFRGSAEAYSLSFKGGTFYAGVEQTKRFKKSSKYTLVCDDSAKSVEYKPISTEKVLKLQALIQSMEVPLNPLPANAKRTEYIFKMKDGTIIYVDASKYNYSYETFRMFVGEPGSMKEVKVQAVERRRDGGTTYVRAADGRVLFAPFSNTEKPTWNGIEIEAIEKEHFDLGSLGIHGLPSETTNLQTPCEAF
jgi:hypothetical protein